MSESVNTEKFNEIGLPARRTGDYRLLTGQEEFSDDFSVPGQLYKVMVRSPYPHAWIAEIHKTGIMEV